MRLILQFSREFCPWDKRDLKETWASLELGSNRLGSVMQNSSTECRVHDVPASKLKNLPVGLMMGMSLKTKFTLLCRGPTFLLWLCLVRKNRRLFNLDGLIWWDKPKSELYGYCGVLQDTSVHQRRAGFEGAGLRGELLLSFCSCCQLCTAVTGIQQLVKHKTTWIGFGSTQHHIMDLITMREESWCAFSTVQPLCRNSCWSNHHLWRPQLSPILPSPYIFREDHLPWHIAN